MAGVLAALDRWFPSNSFLELTFGYNGLDRITGKHAGHSPMSALAQDNPLASQQGFGRMFGAVIGGQISWLLVAALVLTVVMVVLLRKAPRTDPERACAVAFGGWLVVVWLLFDFMTGKGGMFSPYYTVALAPPSPPKLAWARPWCGATVRHVGPDGFAQRSCSGRGCGRWWCWPASRNSCRGCGG